jgi:RNA recognition motif-containing protein
MMQRFHQQQYEEEERVTASRRNNSQEQEPQFKVFVHNLNWSVDWNQLKEVFSSAGDVKFVKVFRGPDGRSRGRGFVAFATQEERDAAISRFDGYNLEGREMRVSEYTQLSPEEFAERKQHSAPQRRERSFSSSEEDRNRKVFVAKLPFAADDATLEQHMSQVGTVTEARVARGPDGKSKGFGFVTFESREAAEQAVSSLSGSDIQGFQIVVKLSDK